MSSAVVPCSSRPKPFLRSLQKGDLTELSLTMRQADRDEISHGTTGSPLSTLITSVGLSKDVQVIEWSGYVVAIFGVVDAGKGVGVPWMLGTDDIQRCRKSLLRGCREVVDGYSKDFPYLTNAVWSKNVVHINWIRWLGFTFEGSDIRNGETFLHFHRRSNV